MTLTHVQTITLPAHAKDGGFDHAAIDTGRGRLYVAHTANDAVDIIDCEAARYIEAIGGLTAVAGALVSESDGLVFTSNRGEDTVGIFGSDDRRVERIKVGVKPNGLAYDSQRKTLIAANVGDPTIAGSFTVSIVDVGTRTLVAEVPVPGRTRWAMFDPIGRLFYVNIMAPPCLIAVDAAERKMVKTVPIPVDGPHGLDLDIERRRLFCACDGGHLLTVSVDSGKIERSADLSGVPDVVFLNTNFKHVYVAVGDPGVIDVFDTDDLRRVATVTTEKGAHTIGFDAARNMVYAFLPQSHGAAVFSARG